MLYLPCLCIYLGAQGSLLDPLLFKTLINTLTSKLIFPCFLLIDDAKTVGSSVRDVVPADLSNLRNWHELWERQFGAARRKLEFFPPEKKLPTAVVMYVTVMHLKSNLDRM